MAHQFSDHFCKIAERSLELAQFIQSSCKNFSDQHDEQKFYLAKTFLQQLVFYIDSEKEILNEALNIIKEDKKIEKEKLQEKLMIRTDNEIYSIDCRLIMNIVLKYFSAKKSPTCKHDLCWYRCTCSENSSYFQGNILSVVYSYIEIEVKRQGNLSGCEWSKRRNLPRSTIQDIAYVVIFRIEEKKKNNVLEDSIDFEDSNMDDDEEEEKEEEHKGNESDESIKIVSDN